MRAFQTSAGLAATALSAPPRWPRLSRAAAAQPGAQHPTGLPVEGQRRAALVKVLRWMISQEPSIHYTQDHGMRLAALGAPYTSPFSTDCSASIKLACAWAQVPDPNGLGLTVPEGYTGTMLTFCKHIKRAAIEPGDFLVLGNWPGEHACAVLEVGSIRSCSHTAARRGPRRSGSRTSSYHKGAPRTG